MSSFNKCSALLLTLTLAFCFPVQSHALSGQKHTSEAASIVRGVNRDIILEINSQIIDTMPWSEISGTFGHRDAWGHLKEWYDHGLAGVPLDAETKGKILSGIRRAIENDTRVSGLTPKQIDAEVEKYYEQLSHVSGKQLITGLLKKNYPSLTAEEVHDLAEMIQMSHLRGDLNTTDNVMIDLSKFRISLLKSPSTAALSGMNKAALTNALKNNPALTAEEFLHAGVNRESMIVQRLNEQYGYKVTAAPGARYASISIGNTRYTVLSDRNRLLTFMRKFPNEKIAVTDSLYHEILKYNQKHPASSAIPLDNIRNLQVKEAELNNSLLLYTQKLTRMIQRQLKLTQILDKIDNCYRTFDSQLSRISTAPNVKAGLNSAIMAAFFSGMSNGWQVMTGDKDPLEALKDTAVDSALAGTSMFISKAIIQQIGPQKWLVTTFANDLYQKAIEQTAEQTFNNAAGAFANFGIATFIFDETRHVYNFCTGDIDEKEFIKATSQSILKAGASGLASSAVVMWGASPGGPVVMAVSMGTYMLVSKALQVYDEIDDKNYFFIEDALGKLPLEIQRNETFFTLNERQGELLAPLQHESIFSQIEGQGELLDSIQHPTIFDRFP